jgi:hypothetical protein
MLHDAFAVRCPSIDPEQDKQTKDVAPLLLEVT